MAEEYKTFTCRSCGCARDWPPNNINLVTATEWKCYECAHTMILDLSEWQSNDIRQIQSIVLAIRAAECRPILRMTKEAATAFQAHWPSYLGPEPQIKFID